MKCEEIENLLIDYLDNQLDQSQRADVDKHIANCERCSDELKDLKEVLEKMDTEKMELPAETLKINFYHMLHAEIEKAPQVRHLNIRLFLRIAAAIALFLAGSFTSALFMNHGKGRTTEIAQLRSEMNDMKKLVMLNMLKDESASQRIQAVSYTDGLSGPDPQVLNALTKTLNQDKNINVRMAAAYSLAKFASVQAVRDTLVESLGKQTEPIIQVVLMNILVDMKEPKAVPSMQRIVSDEKTLKEVKAVAQKSINVLL
ncbi:MAG TPA: zf-HC2 domain-containing protein [Bacteroidales bacterium]|nr:zf-HC2 domain-containing protein [Bacteroidales bacterium]